MKKIYALLFALIPVANCTIVHANKVKVDNRRDEQILVTKYHVHGAGVFDYVTNSDREASVSANSVKNIDQNIEFLFILANGTLYKITLPSGIDTRTTIVVREDTKDGKNGAIEATRNGQEVIIEEVKFPNIVPRRR